MKNLFLLSILLLFSVGIKAQNALDSLVSIGIQYHDNGAYELAIEKYQEALEIDPKSPLVNYEIGMTYMYLEEYEKALMHCDVVLEQKELYILETYITKGSCLDYLGQTKESIKLFKKALKKYGQHHLLYYNLGYDYYKIHEDDKAMESLEMAINLRPGHASSHLLLGYLMSDKKLKSQSLVCLYYFLLLEPESERASAAYDLLMEQLGGNVESNGSDEITIFFDPENADSEFSAADLMVSMLEASKSLEENKDKTPDELFIKNTTSFFTILGELKDDKNKGLWWEFYVPLFYDLAQSDHMDTFCYYISLSSNQEAAVWVRDNEDRLKDFANWLSNP
jgi:hypothetical protein